MVSDVFDARYYLSPLNFVHKRSRVTNTIFIIYDVSKTYTCISGIRSRDQVTSWDTDSGSERTSYSGGRSFIRCISEETSDDTCDGAASNDMGECRMVRGRDSLSY